MFRKRTMTRWLAGAVLAAMSGIGAAQDTGKVIRMVPQADLKIIDPIWTTAFITRNHGYMVYDTLFGVDAEGKVSPQMVDTYTKSPDGKTWTFKLRSGLAFHDGAPVTSADVIQSVKRWGARDGLGQKMMAALDKFEAVDDNNFTMTFKTPFGLVLEALSKPSSMPPFIMPKRVAETPADKQIDDATGSGPYIFKKDEFRPGERIVYTKNTKYVPRTEAPSGTAGGKNVYIDRMEWVILKDAQTQANAIANGEVDMIEWVPAEQYAPLKANPKIELLSVPPKGSFGLHLNRLVPPFDNVKIAQAAYMAISQEALMRAQLVHKDLYNTCTSIYPCGSMYANEKETSYFTGKPQFEKAKALLKEAGYDGTPIVLMWPADFAVINKFPPVMAELLKQAGFRVDMQSMDWPTLVTRRAMKNPANQGGWNAFITGWQVADTMNPMFFAPMNGGGSDKGWFGWPTDEKLEALKGKFLETSDEAERKSLAAQIQKQAYDGAVVAPIGEYKPIVAVRKDVVSGLVQGPAIVFWNLKKN